MKKNLSLWLMVLILLMCSCGQPSGGSEGPTWQEQYDLGLRYLSDGNYEEAIIAFTAAIEIDPKRAPAYVGRGDAYVLSGETEDNLTAAQADYEKAIELDETNVDAYLGLADVYIRQGDYDKALEILRKGLEKSSDQRLQDRLTELDGSDTEEEIPENVSVPVTAVGYIIYNPDLYQETWDPYIEQYQIDEQNIRCAIRSYGIRFEAPMNVQFDSGVYTIQEAEAENVWELFDERTELHNFDADTNGPMIGHRMEMTGYFYFRDEAGELIGPEYNENEQVTCYTYHPNGDYGFFIESYELLD